jgi:hypothetical protein
MSALGFARPISSIQPNPAVGDRRTIPFDYQFHIQTFDPEKPDNSFLNTTISTYLTVSIEAAFVAVSIGYGFTPLQQTRLFGPIVSGPTSPANLTLGDILRSVAVAFGEGNLTPPPSVIGLLEAGGTESANPLNLGPQSEQAILQGIQINPAMLNQLVIALQDGDLMQPDEIAQLFQSTEPPPQRIQFLYALSDKGSGRLFQSEPLLNTAGLGTADGDRPFRELSPPIVFPPRSTIQLDIIPLTDFRGDLYVSLHGYKVLGGIGTPTGHRLQQGLRARNAVRR